MSLYYIHVCDHVLVSVCWDTNRAVEAHSPGCKSAVWWLHSIPSVCPGLCSLGHLTDHMTNIRTVMSYIHVLYCIDNLLQPYLDSANSISLFIIHCILSIAHIMETLTSPLLIITHSHVDVLLTYIHWGLGISIGTFVCKFSEVWVGCIFTQQLTNYILTTDTPISLW